MNQPGHIMSAEKTRSGFEHCSSPGRSLFKAPVKAKRPCKVCLHGNRSRLKLQRDAQPEDRTVHQAEGQQAADRVPVMRQGQARREIQSLSEEPSRCPEIPVV